MEALSKGDLIKADLYSRPNYLNGKYGLCQIVGLGNFREVNGDDVFFLETLQVRADSADKMIAEAESAGSDVSDPDVMKEIGKQINALGLPIHRSESITTAVFVSLRLIVYYVIAVGIWGLAFKTSLLWFGLFGLIAGSLVSLLAGPVIANQRTKERIRDMVTSVGMLWGSVAIIIGVLGLAAWLIRLIFF